MILSAPGTAACFVNASCCFFVYATNSVSSSSDCSLLSSFFGVTVSVTCTLYPSASEVAEDVAEDEGAAEDESAEDECVLKDVAGVVAMKEDEVFERDLVEPVVFGSFVGWAELSSSDMVRCVAVEKKC